jgi:hypothetical protein
VSRAGDEVAAGEYHLPVREASHFLSRERHMMRPVALEVGAGDFAFAAVVAGSPLVYLQAL